jgi:hypothetical protein
MAADLHPDLAHLAPLVGIWEGTGVGDYPSIEAFAYAERVELTHGGRPFLAYRQQTRRAGDHPDAGLPLHAETGYVRPVGSDGLEWVIAQPTGIVEIHEGTIAGTRIELTGRVVAGTSTAKEVATVERRLTVEGDELRYEVWMAAVGLAHQWHLTAELHRVG